MGKAVRVGALVIVVLGMAMAGMAVPIHAAPFGSNPIGSPVAIYGPAGDEIARVTVVSVVDPFEDYEASGAPGTGERFVLAVLSVENTGGRPYDLTPFEVLLLDSLGRVDLSTVVPRTARSIAEVADLPTVTLNPGESISGAVLYRVPADAELVLLFYSFVREAPQLYALADLSPGATGASNGNDAARADSTDVRETGRFAESAGERAEASNGGAGDADDADTPAVMVEPTAEHCAWVTGTIERLSALAPVGAELQGMDDEVDPARLREIAAQLAAAADDQRASGPPAGAGEANAQIADALDRYAVALDAIAGAVEAGESPDTTALLADVQDANALIESASRVTGPLTEACAAR